MNRRLPPRCRRLLLVAVALSACNPGAEEARRLDASCATGDAEACAELGRRVRAGEYVLSDWRRAAELFGQACEGAAWESCVELGRMHVDDRAEGRGLVRDSALAARHLERGCTGGAMRGCTTLADLYATPDSAQGPDAEPSALPQDLGRAAELYERACEGADPRGCTRLGIMLEKGRAVERDPARAATLYDRACEGGGHFGCALLGASYETGSGVSTDLDRAAALYEDACEAETAGCLGLARLQMLGVDGPPDHARAAELLEEGCYAARSDEDGWSSVAESCFRMGELLAAGTGVDRDLPRAASRFRRACRLGYEEACTR